MNGILPPEPGFGKRPPQALLLAALTVIVLLPFAGKAFHIDDPLFLWTARQIHEEPLDFYGFEVNWYGSPMPMHEVTQNPPLAGYFIALAALFVGWNEIGLRLAFLLPAVAVTLGTFRLARRFCDRPWMAAGFVVATPVFLMSASSLTSDLIMLALWVWAVELWLAGLESGRRLQLGLAALLVAAAALTKYFAMALIPLLLLHAVARKRPLAGAWMIVPIVALGLYEWTTRTLYGEGLLTQAGAYTRFIFEIDKAGQLAVMQQKIFVGVVFAGGCLLTSLGYATRLWNRAWLAMGFAVGLVATAAVSVPAARTLYGYSIGGDDDLRWGLIVQLLVLFLAGLHVVGLAATTLVRFRDADELLLGLWGVGTLVFACALNWTVNGRSVLPVLPAIAILLVRRLQSGEAAGKRPGVGPTWIPLAVGLAIALGVTWADYRHAGSARSAARVIASRYSTPERPVRFQGHWGFQWYMEQSDGRAVDLRVGRLAAGSIMVAPQNNTSVHRPAAGTVTPVETVELGGGGWISTMSPRNGSGYHAARVRGPLPFALGRVATDKYDVYRTTGNPPRRPARP